MNSPFFYSSTFSLSKQYLTECYDESITVIPLWRAYGRSLSMIIIATLLFEFTETDIYISSFILILGIVDTAGTYYQKAWWLARQALSSSYNSEVKLTINEEGISTHSTQAKNTILWGDIAQAKQGNKGILIYHSKGKSYLSSSTLDRSAIEYIHNRVKPKLE